MIDLIYSAVKTYRRRAARRAAERRLRVAKRAVMRHVEIEKRDGFDDFVGFQRLHLDVLIAESQVLELGGRV